ncbi:MAG: hypothetical protein ABW122_06730 [Ilumatobacteraceae bacterium]
MRILGLAAGCGLVLLAACNGGDADSARDPGSFRAAYGDVHPSGGRVIAVSTAGRVLVEGSTDEEVCAAESDGTAVGCWDTAQRLVPGTGVSFSPDGTKVAFDTNPQRMQLGRSSVHVLDMTTGDVTALGGAEAGTDGGPQDFIPTWQDDDAVVFLRQSTSDDPGLQIVHASLDGDIDVADVADITALDVAATSAAVLDDRYTVAVTPAGTGSTGQLVGIDDEGATSVVGDLAEPGAEVGGIDRDGEHAAFVSGLRRAMPRVVFVDGEGATSTDLAAVATTVSPDGRTIAAFAPSAAGARDAVILLAPGQESTSATVLTPGEQDATVDGASGVVWTDDDALVVWDAESWQVVTLTAA